MFKIGNHSIASSVLLAPMAGVTDIPFRRLCLAFGAGLATSEMITSDTRLWQSRKTKSRLIQDSTAPVVSMQIAGSEPEMLADAAKAAVSLGADIIDINMGCPAKKVCKKLAGSALLKDERLVSDILKAVVNSVDVPVTLKTRTGWDDSNKNISRVAKIAEDAGIQAITIHGRTRASRFMGNAEYDTIAEVVAKAQIPVIANGDIATPEKAQQVLKHTGAAAVMVGRASLGNPWLFREIQHYLATGQNVAPVSKEELKRTIKQHIHAMHDFYGGIKGVRIARKHVAWYNKHFPQAPAFNRHFNTLESPQSQLDAVDDLFHRPDIYEEIAA